MAKTKTKKPKKRTSSVRVDSKAKPAEEIQNLRNKVTNRIFRSSETMADRVIQSVTEGGQVSALKYLWQMAGLFPHDETDDGTERESLAKILLERMGLQGKPPVRPGEDEGDVESEEEQEELD